MRNANSATGKSCEDESLREVLGASKFERRRACRSGHDCGVCVVLQAGQSIAKIIGDICTGFRLAMLCSKWWCRVYWDVEVVVAVQRRHVKMYSPRKTWESSSSQPYLKRYGWQARRTQGLASKSVSIAELSQNKYGV